MSLPTPQTWLQRLQGKLHAKAKAEPRLRFYSLWDKVCHEQTLSEAFRRCRANGGRGGVDGQEFVDIETYGRERWLGQLRQDLTTGAYRPKALRRVWIPKSNGKLRPLSIPTIRDRVVQTAVVLVIEPIFEVDLLPQQYGFRRGLDAKMAVRRVFFHLRDGRHEVVDGDLRDYFTTIPHRDLMKCVARRISDRRVLSVVRRWLRAPVVEQGRTTATRRGTPQGGVISPLLSNVYFRRFLLAWQQRGLAAHLNAHVVNYADDFVICCRRGSGGKALTHARHILGAMQLEMNDEKTRLVTLPEGRFDFLGYTFGRFYARSDGCRSYLGTRPSQKALKRVRQRIHEETSRRWNTTPVEERVQEINAVLRGWCGYFDQGPVFREYRMVTEYTERRLRRWLMAKHRRRGTGYRQYPDEYLYDVLGLYKPWVQTRQLARSEGTTS